RPRTSESGDQPVDSRSGRRQRLPLRYSICRRRGRDQCARPRRVPCHLPAIRHGAANRPANLAEVREQVPPEMTAPTTSAPPRILNHEGTKNTKKKQERPSCSSCLHG